LFLLVHPHCLPLRSLFLLRAMALLARCFLFFPPDQFVSFTFFQLGRKALFFRPFDRGCSPFFFLPLATKEPQSIFLLNCFCSLCPTPLYSLLSFRVSHFFFFLLRLHVLLFPLLFLSSIFGCMRASKNGPPCSSFSFLQGRFSPWPAALSFFFFQHTVGPPSVAGHPLVNTVPCPPPDSRLVVSTVQLFFFSFASPIPLPQTACFSFLCCFAFTCQCLHVFPPRRPSPPPPSLKFRALNFIRLIHTFASRFRFLFFAKALPHSALVLPPV